MVNEMEVALVERVGAASLNVTPSEINANTFYQMTNRYGRVEDSSPTGGRVNFPLHEQTVMLEQVSCVQAPQNPEGLPFQTVSSIIPANPVLQGPEVVQTSSPFILSWSKWSQVS